MPRTRACVYSHLTRAARDDFCESCKRAPLREKGATNGSTPSIGIVYIEVSVLATLEGVGGRSVIDV
jgi:hypothetical protein